MACELWAVLLAPDASDWYIVPHQTWTSGQEYPDCERRDDVPHHLWEHNGNIYPLHEQEIDTPAFFKQILEEYLTVVIEDQLTENDRTKLPGIFKDSGVESLMFDPRGNLRGWHWLTPSGHGRTEQAAGSLQLLQGCATQAKQGALSAGLHD
ncbi:hypothetical protein OE88DRAFT_1641452 [Heliocybe sulcata]|uniref:Uncharacterized protein n=1 Tax=Heliocybe sulcata TaxID=5364 RepID=A0A5C3NE41_9AGAM|nr:hypothetical protein OE88DRAFT_1641452 [Heliocybe sulcata]